MYEGLYLTRGFDSRQIHQLLRVSMKIYTNQELIQELEIIKEDNSSDEEAGNMLNQVMGKLFMLSAKEPEPVSVRTMDFEDTTYVSVCY